jgi:hypothetical protein
LSSELGRPQKYNGRTPIITRTAGIAMAISKEESERRYLH